MEKIGLTKGMFAIIDDDDFARVTAHRWNASESNRGYFYARRLDGKTPVYMHRFIMRFPDGEIDHINRNKLDNRKENLRLANRSQQLANTVKRKNSEQLYKGVRRRGNHFQARIMINGETTYIGTFKSEKEAAAAYNKTAIKHFGEFARVNVI